MRLWSGSRHASPGVRIGGFYRLGIANRTCSSVDSVMSDSESLTPGRRPGQLRILHPAPTSLPANHRLGGATQRRIVELAEAQARLGDDVTVLSSFAEDVGTQAGVRYTATTCKLSRPARDLEFAARGYRASHGFDVLHFHGFPLAPRCRPAPSSSSASITSNFVAPICHLARRSTRRRLSTLIESFRSPLTAQKDSWPIGMSTWHCGSFQMG